MPVSRLIMRAIAPGLLVCSLLLAGACARDDASPWPPQKWEDITVRLETRPLRITSPGMVEFLVVATREPRGPAHNLLVYIRTDQGGKWHQAIQDGHLGVYRRALAVRDPATDVLEVRIEYDNRVGTMHFPIAVSADDNAAPAATAG